MGWQAVDHQVHGPFAAPHHFLQQGHEELGREASLIRAIPEGATIIDSGCGADRLALTRALNDRGLPFQTPRLAVHGIGTKAGFIPEIDVATRGFGLPCDIGKALPAPFINRFRVALVSALQWLLRCQSELGEQFSHRG